MRLADFLEPDDRDALLGDLAESGTKQLESSLEILTLLIRRNMVAWIVSIGAAIWLTFSLTVLARGVHLWFFVLRNYRDLDPAVLAETGLRWHDIIRLFASGAWLPATCALIAGLVLAKRSRQATALNLGLFLAVSTIAMVWRGLVLPWFLNPTAANAIFLEITLIWMPVLIGTRLRRTE